MRFIGRFSTASIVVFCTLTPTVACEGLWLDAYGAATNICETARSQWSGLISQPTSDGEIKGNRILAGDVDELNIIAGQKTIEAGDTRAMVMAILQDKHGNPARDGSLARFALRYSNIHQTYENLSQDGIATWIFRAKNGAATGYATANASERQSKRADLHIIANQVATLNLSTSAGGISPALGQKSLMANGLQDRFGNPAHEGMLVRFRGQSKNGDVHLATALLANGSASAFVSTPNNSRTIEWRGHAGPAMSEPVSSQVENQWLANQTQLSYEINPITSTIRFAVGPLNTWSGHRVIDGTPVRFILTASDLAEAMPLAVPGRLLNGTAKATLPIFVDAKRLKIEVLLQGASFVGHIATQRLSETITIYKNIHGELRGGV